MFNNLLRCLLPIWTIFLGLSYVSPAQAHEQTIFFPGDNHTWHIDHSSEPPIATFVRITDSFLQESTQIRYAHHHMRMAGIPDSRVSTIFRGEETDGNLYARKTLLEQAVIKFAFEEIVGEFPSDTTFNVFAHSGGAPLALWSVCTNPVINVSVLTLSAPGLDTFRLHRRGFDDDPVLSTTRAPAFGLYNAWRLGNVIRHPEMLAGCEAKMRQGMRIRIVASNDDEIVTPDLWNELIWRFDDMDKATPMPEDFFRVIMIPGASHAKVGEAAARHHGLAINGNEGTAGLDWRQLNPLFAPE